MTLFGQVRECAQAILTLENPWKTACVAVGAYFIAKKGLTPLIRRLGGRYMQEQTVDVSNRRDDVVYLFVFPNKYTKQCPNLSPFAIKVETWLKLKKIKYEIIETTRFSQDTHQIPYIQLNGVPVSDSTLIIDYLTCYFKLDTSEGLTPELIGVSRAFQRMVDESMSWTYLVDRYVYRPELFAKVFRPQGRSRFICEKIRTGLQNMYKTRAHHQGSGRHSQTTLAVIGQQDVRAISLYLGDKQFLMGDEITKVDCAIFGHLSQIAFVDFPYAHKDLLNMECSNLRHYLYRIREKLWPDWFIRSDPGEFTQ